VAFKPDTGTVLWQYPSDEFIDSRGVCMKGGRIFLYSPGRSVTCLDAKSGQRVWKTSDKALLKAIGPNGKAQLYLTGFSTTTYIKCNDKYVFFAGPQRRNLVVISAKTGELVWQKRHGNRRLILFDDAFYSFDERRSGTRKGMKCKYSDGSILAWYSARVSCTRPTASIDSIFLRGTGVRGSGGNSAGGTVRVNVLNDQETVLGSMRPPCNDGVIVSDGLLHWGPWTCGCLLSLYGNVCLSPAANPPARINNAGQRVEYGKPRALNVPQANVSPRDLKGDETGAVSAIDRSTGKAKWKSYTGGAVFQQPVVWKNRVYAGSADGFVYAFEAATGRLIWRFQAAPAERVIPVYGKLHSTWPVSGGVAVKDGVVYAAAGLNNWDGTYVYALGAITGKPKWVNDSSGIVSKTWQNGISLQGRLRIGNGELQFKGGNVYKMARYDLKTGKCLNEPFDSIKARSRTRFRAYY